MIAPRIAPSVRPRRNEEVVRSSPGSLTCGAPTGRGSPLPRRCAMPTQATIEAASRWKSPIVRTSKPSRSARASPAHAPRIAADDDDRQPAAGVAPDQDVQRRVEDPDEDRQDERRIEAHATARPRPARPRRGAGRVDRGTIRGRRRGARSGRRRARPRRRTAPPPDRARPPRPARRSRRPSGRRGPARRGRRTDRRGDRRARGAGSGPRHGTATGARARRRRRTSTRSSVERRRLEVLAATERDRVRQRIDPR